LAVSRLAAAGLLLLAAALGPAGVARRAAAAEAGRFDALIGTYSVGAFDLMTAGKLTGCAIEFTTVLKQSEGGTARYLRVSGDLSVSTVGNTVGPSIRIAADDISDGVNALPLAQKLAYLTLGRRDTIDDIEAASPTDAAGAVTYRLNSQALLLLLEGIAVNRIRLGVLVEGGAALDTPLDLDVVETKPDGAKTRDPGRVQRQFNGCTARLSKGGK
jgi:hypothetical protein